MVTVPLSKLNDIRVLLHHLPEVDREAMAACHARETTLTKPPGSLGKLEDIALWLCGWQGRHPPRLDHIRARIFAGNHGVAALGVSAFPAEVTAQMVENFRRGGGAINQLCRTFGTELDVVCLDLDHPTADFTTASAMTEAEFVRAFQTGMDAVPDPTDLLFVGEMGIGNTTAAAAVAYALFGGAAEYWTGKGTGVEGPAFLRKIEVVSAGVDRHHNAGTPLDILCCLGGRELAAMAGAILAARLKRIPVLLDGFICVAAAAVLEREHKGALDHCIAGHVSAEAAHRRLLAAVGKHPLLDLGMRLGEGSGAAIAVGIVRAALECHQGMATFAEAAVSR